MLPDIVIKKRSTARSALMLECPTNSWRLLPGLLPAATAQPPKLVFIPAADLGWSVLGGHGGDSQEATKLERLAARGAQPTDAFAAAPVYSPELTDKLEFNRCPC